jgi:hypothetical protein
LERDGARLALCARGKGGDTLRKPRCLGILVLLSGLCYGSSAAVGFGCEEQGEPAIGAVRADLDVDDFSAGG